MISNERPSPYGGTWAAQTAPKPRSIETTLKLERIQIERKAFTLMLKENDRGRFLRITEEMNGRRNAVIIPSTGLEDFSRIVQEMLCADRQKRDSDGNR